MSKKASKKSSTLVDPFADDNDDNNRHQQAADGSVKMPSEKRLAELVDVLQKDFRFLDRDTSVRRREHIESFVSPIGIRNTCNIST